VSGGRAAPLGDFDPAAIEVIEELVGIGSYFLSPSASFGFGPVMLRSPRVPKYHIVNSEKNSSSWSRHRMIQSPLLDFSPAHQFARTGIDAGTTILCANSCRQMSRPK
jgi:hypothetical protein